LEIDDMREVPNIMPMSTAVHGGPTAVISTGTGTSSYNEDNGEVNPLPENQSDSDSRFMENNTYGEVEAPPSHPI